MDSWLRGNRYEKQQYYWQEKVKKKYTKYVFPHITPPSRGNNILEEIVYNEKY